MGPIKIIRHQKAKPKKKPKDQAKKPIGAKKHQKARPQIKQFKKRCKNAIKIKSFESQLF